MAPPTQAGPASPAVGGKENLNLPQDAQLQELHAELSHARNALREMVCATLRPQGPPSLWRARCCGQRVPQQRARARPRPRWAGLLRPRLTCGVPGLRRRAASWGRTPARAAEYVREGTQATAPLPKSVSPTTALRPAARRCSLLSNLRPPRARVAGLQDMLAESKCEVERTKSELATVTARLAEAQSHVARAIQVMPWRRRRPPAGAGAHCGGRNVHSCPQHVASCRQECAPAGMAPAIPVGAPRCRDSHASPRSQHLRLPGAPPAPWTRPHPLASIPTGKVQGLTRTGAHRQNKTRKNGSGRAWIAQNSKFRYDPLLPKNQGCGSYGNVRTGRSATSKKRFF